MKRTFWAKCAIAALLAALAAPVAAGEIPIIDAHSQVDQNADLERIIPLMDKAGVVRTILSPRAKLRPRAFLRFASRHPDRITPAVRTKGRRFNVNHPKFYRSLSKQLDSGKFGAMAEVILWHAQKGDKAPEITVPMDSPQVKATIEAAVERNWPFIAHIEFGSAGDNYDMFMKALEAMLDADPDHPFALIHMGQLSADEVRRLIGAHRNVHFLMSRANPIAAAANNQPWTDMFDGGGTALAPKWRELVLRYPDRFILAFDNVFAEDWSYFYLDQAALWRKALARLPDKVARALAYGNAQRLWHLPPVD